MSLTRAFPIHLGPVPGEALDSWLEALAQRMHTRLADLLVATGLTGRDDGQVNGTRDWAVLIGNGEAAGIAAATGVAPAEVAAMTLAHYDGTALRIDRARRQVSRHHLWGRGSGSRFCPDCLASSGGRWQLAWRLGWCFACPAHRRLLADVCPECGRVQRQRPHPGHVIPHPGHCAGPTLGSAGLAEQRCNADLTHADTPRLRDDHPALAAQRLLLEAIRSGTATFGVYGSDPQPTSIALSDVRALANRALTHSTDEDLSAVVPVDLLNARDEARERSGRSTGPCDPQSRPGFMAPSHAGKAAVGVTAAIAVLGAADIPRAGAALRWLVEGSRRRGRTVSPTTASSWGRGTSETLAAIQLSALEPLLRPSDRLRYRTASNKPRHPEPGSGITDRRARRTPTLLWPEWSLQLSLPHCYQHHLRRALSCAVLLVGTRLRLTDTARLLGQSTTAQSVSRIFQLLEADPHWPDILTAITRIADHLETHDVPVDYQRRRELDYDTLLPDDTWARLCRNTGRHQGPQMAAVVRSLLFERISGLPAVRAPFAIDDSGFRAKVASFPIHLTPELAAGLHDEAKDFLHRHQIWDEPVSWHPPSTLLSDLKLPGPDPNRVDITRLHSLIREDVTGLQETAKRLDTTIDAVRHLLQQHPAPTRPQPGVRVLATVRAELTKHKLIELYHHQQLSLREIGQRTGASRQTIARLARDYDIGLRQAPSPRHVIARDWLHEQYVTHRRTLPDLARETGMSTANMNRWAHIHNIPLRTRGEPSHQQHLREINRASEAPKILRPALSGVGGWTRLQRFAAASDYPTIGAAAKALAANQSALTTQINRLERELCGQLLVRAERGSHMQLTAHGERVVAAVRRHNQHLS
jgi:DNA-binding transcriptional LysR family regulator